MYKKYFFILTLIVFVMLSGCKKQIQSLELSNYDNENLGFGIFGGGKSYSGKIIVSPSNINKNDIIIVVDQAGFADIEMKEKEGNEIEYIVTAKYNGVFNLSAQCKDGSVKSQEKKFIITGGRMNPDIETPLKLACQDVNIDYSLIQNYEKIEDWVGGSRYKFSYQGKSLIVYENFDLTINSINIGDIRVYWQGKNPLNVNDYLIDTNMSSQLPIWAEDTIKKFLNFPSTADFPLLDWATGRNKEVYMVSSYVDAKNGFGVEDRLYFYIEYNQYGNPLYCILDGQVVIGAESAVIVDIRTDISSDSNNDSTGDNIVINYNEIGEYGREVLIDGYRSVYFYVPAGTYKVKASLKNSKLFLNEIETITNSEGYQEDIVITTLTFTDILDEQILIVCDDQRISITIYSSFTLTPID